MYALHCIYTGQPQHKGTVKIMICCQTLDPGIHVYVTLTCIPFFKDQIHQLKNINAMGKCIPQMSYFLTIILSDLSVCCLKKAFAGTSVCLVSFLQQIFSQLTKRMDNLTLMPVHNYNELLMSSNRN